MTPLEAVYGQNPPSVLSYMPGFSKVQEVEKNIIVCEALLCALKDNWSWLKIALRNKQIMVILNAILLKGTRYFFDYNLISILHSKLNIVRNLRPTFMVLIQCSNMWYQWPFH
jgi:hypothetical protein